MKHKRFFLVLFVGIAGVTINSYSQFPNVVFCGEGNVDEGLEQFCNEPSFPACVSKFCPFCFLCLYFVLLCSIFSCADCYTIIVVAA
jgi:hypothetical protein